VIQLRDGLPPAVIGQAVAATGLKPVPHAVLKQFSLYFDLLERWNAKLNLTAIRQPEEILRRHFLECIFCAQVLPPGIQTLLDYGSGAGFPGIPIALCRPEIKVTLAESQAKKASFLREVVRTLDVEAEVYAGRVEELPAASVFGAVTLRAVDKMEQAIAAATTRVAKAGWLTVLASRGAIFLPEGFEMSERALPDSENGVLLLGRRVNVPRETSD
jgi:16S rRNA (guanine527-N7)-methyltransferase